MDAAMRQLWLTGWMNNYMRHVVASFLIAYLHLPWQEGYRWFQVRKVVMGMSIAGRAVVYRWPPPF